MSLWDATILYRRETDSKSCLAPVMQKQKHFIEWIQLNPLFYQKNKIWWNSILYASKLSNIDSKIHTKMGIYEKWVKNTNFLCYGQQDNENRALLLSLKYQTLALDQLKVCKGGKLTGKNDPILSQFKMSSICTRRRKGSRGTKEGVIQPVGVVGGQREQYGW